MDECPPDVFHWPSTVLSACESTKILSERTLKIQHKIGCNGLTPSTLEQSEIHAEGLHVAPLRQLNVNADEV